MLVHAFKTLSGAARTAGRPGRAPASKHLPQARRTPSGAPDAREPCGEVCAQALYQAQALHAATRPAPASWSRRPATKPTTLPGREQRCVSWTDASLL